MQHDRLLLDASGCDSGASKRTQYIELARRLTAQSDEPVSHRTVEKWFERKSIPSGWLVKIVTAAPRPINIADYA